MKLLFSLLFTADVFTYVAWCNAVVLCRGVSQRVDRSLTGPTGLQANNDGFSARLNILADRFPIVSLQAIFRPMLSGEVGRFRPD
jgi:hypothetical protein